MVSVSSHKVWTSSLYAANDTPQSFNLEIAPGLIVSSMAEHMNYSILELFATTMMGPRN
jgi:hypothetical protein